MRASRIITPAVMSAAIVTSVAAGVAAPVIASAGTSAMNVHNGAVVADGVTPDMNVHNG